jgi:pyridoxal phosphate enzyme (YggS family)
MISTNVHNFRTILGDAVKMVAVSKGRSIPEIRIAKEVGVRAFGENRIQEALPKIAAIKDTEWHFIGKLQSNKVAQAVEKFALIQSVDSVKLAEKINKAAGELGKKMDILLQINTAKDNRQGFAINEFDSALKTISQLNNINVLGIMAIGPLKKDPRPCFNAAKNIFDKYKFRYLSMGMTDDWQRAVECGSNMVRIGRGIFE